MFASNCTGCPSSVTAGGGAADRSRARSTSTLALPESVLFQHDRRGVHQRHARFAVDDDPVVCRISLIRPRAHPPRHAAASRHDRGVRGTTADIGDEALEYAGRESACPPARCRTPPAPADPPRRSHAPAGWGARRRSHGRGSWCQAFDDLFEVGLPFAQVLVFSISSNWTRANSSRAESAHSAL